jgi:hypothetical protein
VRRELRAFGIDEETEAVLEVAITHLNLFTLLVQKCKY